MKYPHTKLAAVIMVSSPIESEWMMTLSWIVCLDIQISAALTACSSANMIGVWFEIMSLISSSVSLMKHAVIPFIWELGSVWIEVGKYGSFCYCCSFRTTFLPDGVLRIIIWMGAFQQWSRFVGPCRCDWRYADFLLEPSCIDWSGSVVKDSGIFFLNFSLNSV